MEHISFYKNFNLLKYTTIKVGGCTEYFSEPSSISELVKIIDWAKINNHKCQIIGAGSNLLINNIFLKGLTICTKKLRSIQIDPKSGIVEAECGVMLPKMSYCLANNALSGGEWLVGIPGTIGGAIYMNASSNKISITDYLISVTAMDYRNLEIIEIKKEDLNFEYRFSPFQKNNFIILTAKFNFETKGNIQKLIDNTKKNLRRKTETQPYHLPSFGSVFKNPINHYAGKLIEETGLKGKQVGGAEISNLHANFIVNHSSATSEDIVHLINLIQQKVLQNKGIFLQPEVRMIGFDYP